MATHSSILAWKIPWTEKPGRLLSMGLPRVRHDQATSISFFLSFFHLQPYTQSVVIPIGTLDKAITLGFITLAITVVFHLRGTCTNHDDPWRIRGRASIYLDWGT